MPLNTSNMCYDNEIRIAGIKQALLRQRHIKREAWKAGVVQNAANAERQRIAAGYAPAAPAATSPPSAFAAVSADTRHVRIREITAEINRLATELTSLT